MTNSNGLTIDAVVVVIIFTLGCIFVVGRVFRESNETSIIIV